MPLRRPFSGRPTPDAFEPFLFGLPFVARVAHAAMVRAVVTAALTARHDVIVVSRRPIAPVCRALWAAGAAADRIVGKDLVAQCSARACGAATPATRHQSSSSSVDKDGSCSVHLRMLQCSVTPRELSR